MTIVFNITSSRLAKPKVARTTDFTPAMSDAMLKCINDPKCDCGILCSNCGALGPVQIFNCLIKRGIIIQ